MHASDGRERSAQVTNGYSALGKERNIATAAAETDINFAAWGIGRHACPGRFFAVDLIKVVLNYVLMNYEVQPLEERPENIWIEYNVIPSPPAKLSVKRRKAGSAKEKGPTEIRL